MRTTQQYSITLPHEMAEAVEAKVKSGSYASVSEVMRDGVRALLERDSAFEKWLREEVTLSFEEYKADPSSAIPIDEVMGRILKRSDDRRRNRK